MTSPNSPSHVKEHSSDYYYFVIAAIAVLLLASNILVAGCCSRCRLIPIVKRFLQSRGILPSSPEDDSISRVIPSCKYTEEKAAAESECPVCLMPFAEGEDVRQMPKCKHVFHAPCIDMWLYSHSNCPICRADVFQKAMQSHHMTTSEGTSYSMTGVVISMP